MAECRMCPHPNECAFVSCDCTCHTSPKLRADLAAMTKRAEAAERERDEAMGLVRRWSVAPVAAAYDVERVAQLRVDSIVAITGANRKGGG